MADKTKLKKDQTPAKPDIVAMAQKKRHIFLLQKLQAGRPLSRPELKELSKYEGNQDPAGVVDSREKVAKAFNVSIRTAERWVKDGMPIRNDSKYDLMEIQAWRFVRKRKRADKDSHIKADAETRYRVAKADREELALAKVKGELIPRDVAEQAFMDRITAIKTHFLALPTHVAPQLVGLEVPEINRILTKRISEIIDGFAKGKY